MLCTITRIVKSYFTLANAFFKLKYIFLLVGARALVGVSEKEIFQQIQQMKQLTKKEGDEKKKNSPYANPPQLILTPTGYVFILFIYVLVFVR